MPLTKQQLLIPRVLCIGGKDSKQGDRLWPESRLKVGDILTLNYGIYWCGEFESGYYDGLCEEFPHLFKPLPWWEKRSKSDMPEYIKWIYPGTKEISYHKVFQWLSNSAGIYVADVEIGNIFIKDIEPADESEYQEYQKQKGA